MGGGDGRVAREWAKNFPRLPRPRMWMGGVWSGSCIAWVGGVVAEEAGDDVEKLVTALGSWLLDELRI